MIQSTLRRQNKPVAMPGQHLADQRLVRAIPIERRGVNEVNPLFQRIQQHRRRLSMRGRRAIAVAEPHATKPDCVDRKRPNAALIHLNT